MGQGSAGRSLPPTIAGQNAGYPGDTYRGNSGALPTGNPGTVDLPGALQALGKSADHSWLTQLNPDPETERNAPNKRSRQVRSGHYVRVRPTPLPKPGLVIHSPAMAESLGLSEAECTSKAFVEFFSGYQDRVPGLESWCTPYALAIMGTPYYNNCPFGNGNGYGDGRAISVGEVVVDGHRWEMQLKGGGTTPFCRGADGRAVLRSSIREFLASEAMHNLGVDTTRALSLVVSGTETARRPWYSGGSDEDPDTMIKESCAITTRVAPSFLRVGHVDLFARRAVARGATEEQRQEHEQLVEHVIFREYSDVEVDASIQIRAAAMLEAAASRMGAMVAGWLRVGFCQGNFNADNCLVGGRTMDYGPFGWIELYDPHFAKWVGSGRHFAFMNQPNALIANYQTFVSAVAPVLSSSSKAKEIAQRGARRIQEITDDVWRMKMGFSTEGAKQAGVLWRELEPLMRRSQIDYTIFWRQLACVAEGAASTGHEHDSLVAFIADAFYAQPAGQLSASWATWLGKWLEAVSLDSALNAVAERLRATNPKYVPREWMLIEAYDKASRGDYSVVQELYKLFLRPYDEQPEYEEKYYRRAPIAALKNGGCAHMT